MRLRPDLVAIVVAVLVFVALSATLTDVWEARYPVGDTDLYQLYGERMADGRVPYRDFDVEYPPGALPAFLLPALVASGQGSYALLFAALMVACGAVAIVLAAAALGALGASRARTWAALAVIAVSPLLLGGLILTRFDLFPAALTVGALALLASGRDRLGAGVLGGAIAVKLYPLVLLPLAVTWTWRRRGRREGLVALGICAAVVLAVFLPFLLVAPSGVVESMGRQFSRPLQIESLGAATLLALHHTFGMPLAWESSHGSQNLTGTGAAVAAVLTSVAQLVVLGWLWVRFARGAMTAERLVRHAAAATVAFVALGKVLSPQFLIWLLPLVPLVAGAGGVAATALLVAACLLTRGWFPGDYWELVKEFDPRASWLLFLRDLALVALLGVLVVSRPLRRSTAREPEPARSPLPGRSPART